MPLMHDTLRKFKTGNVFFETGTYRGDGIARAIEAGFDSVFSVEIDQNFIDAANLRFHDAVSSGKVKILQGDTKVMMGGALAGIMEPIIFWLDAHWDFGPVKGEAACPLYEELAFIKAHPIKTHTILIDDMRLMGTSHHWGRTMSGNIIINMVKEINRDYCICFTDGDLGPDGGICKNDIMVAVLK